MNLLKIIAAAVVGVALGIGLMVAMEAYARMEYGWIVILVGLLAGLSMRWIAGTGRESYLRGGLAALLTLAIFIAGKYVVATVIMTEREMNLPPRVAGAADDAPEDDDTGEADPIIPAALDAPVRSASPVLQTDPNNLNINVLDAVWLVVGALVAYQLGKGRNARTASETTSSGDGATEEPQRPMGDDPSN